MIVLDGNRPAPRRRRIIKISTATPRKVVKRPPPRYATPKPPPKRRFSIPRTTKSPYVAPPKPVVSAPVTIAVQPEDVKDVNELFDSYFEENEGEDFDEDFLGYGGFAYTAMLKPRFPKFSNPTPFVKGKKGAGHGIPLYTTGKNVGGYSKAGYTGYNKNQGIPNFQIDPNLQPSQHIQNKFNPAGPMIPELVKSYMNTGSLTAGLKNNPPTYYDPNVIQQQAGEVYDNIKSGVDTVKNFATSGWVKWALIGGAGLLLVVLIMGMSKKDDIAKYIPYLKAR